MTRYHIHPEAFASANHLLVESSSIVEKILRAFGSELILVHVIT